MRDIEFRAWHIENKSMVFFDYKRIVNDVIQMQHFCELLNGTHNDGVIMQYTGLKDKNGVKIFEGDILRDTDDFSINKVLMAKNGTWMWEGEDVCDFTEIIEVIGNIHENPELLS